MGLGLLLCGYLFCLNLLNVYFLPFATVLMFWGLRKLSFVNPALSRAKYLLFPLFFVGMGGLTLVILKSFFIKIPQYATVMRVLSCLSHIGMLIFLTILFSGIRRLTDEVGLYTLSAKAIRNRLFCCFYYIPAFLLELPFWKDSLFLRTASLFTVLLGILVFLLNALLLHDCFRKICMPNHPCDPE